MTLQRFIVRGFLLFAFSTVAAGNAYAVNLFYNTEVQLQTIVGFGGGLVFDKYPFNHPRKDELYDSIFNNAQINVLRICNWYNPQENNAVKEIPMLREINEKWPHVKTMLASWSPPPYLKNNNSIAGVLVTKVDTGEVLSPATLRKNGDSTYMYKEYGEYWYQSLKHFSDSGVTFDWVSIQNEPDVWSDYEGCQFDSVENPIIASYGKALAAVYNACDNRFSTPIRFIGPDVAGMSNNRLQGYVESSETDKSMFTALSHHYYDYAAPAFMMLTAEQYKNIPLFQTEFLVNEGKNWMGVEQSWFDHAGIILDELKYEHVAVYCIFALTYKPASTHCFFSLDTLGGDGYEIRPTWYMFKHYSRSIHRGWHQLLAETDDSLVSSVVFSSPAQDSFAIVLVNKATEERSINYEFPGMTGRMYQTTDSLKYVETPGLTSGGSVTLPFRSITTLEFHINSAAVSAPAVSKAAQHPGIGSVTRAAAGFLRVAFAAPFGSATITITDIRGRTVSRTNIGAAHRRDGVAVVRCNTAPGLYTISLTGGTSRFTRTCVVGR